MANRLLLAVAIVIAMSVSSAQAAVGTCEFGNVTGCTPSLSFLVSATTAPSGNELDK
jgi:hypothetical protein